MTEAEQTLAQRAQAVLASYQAHIQQQHRDAWARIEPDITTLASQGKPSHGKKIKVYEVHHLVARARETYWTHLISGFASDHCERLVRSSYGI